MTTEDLAKELEDEAHGFPTPPEDEGRFEALRAILRAAAARLRELSEALKPFGEAAEDAEDLEDWEHIWENPSAMTLTAAHLRRAAQLTEKQP